MKTAKSHFLILKGQDGGQGRPMTFLIVIHKAKLYCCKLSGFNSRHTAPSNIWKPEVSESLLHQKELLGASASHPGREHSQWAQNTVCSAPQHSVCVCVGGLLWRKNSNISTRLWVSELASPANLVPSSKGASAEEPAHIRLACSSLGRNKEGSRASPGAAFLWGFYFKLLLLRFCLSFLKQRTVVYALRQTLYSLYSGCRVCPSDRRPN